MRTVHAAVTTMEGLRHATPSVECGTNFMCVAGLSKTGREANRLFGVGRSVVVRLNQTLFRNERERERERRVFFSLYSFIKSAVFTLLDIYYY